MAHNISVGIVGLPNVGKSTLFKTLTRKQVDCSNYPFATIDPNVGVVAVPDERVDKLAEAENSVKRIYAAVEFVDIAGLVKGASQGEGLGNKFLSHIREVDAILYVLRAFLDKDVINTQPDVDPLRDKEILDTELALKDLETIQKRLEGLEKEVRAGKKEAFKETEVFAKAKSSLEKGVLLVEQDFSDEEKRVLQNCQLLTLKPRLYLLNAQDREIKPAVVRTFQENNWPFLVIDLLTEQEVVDFSPNERISLGLNVESELGLLVKKSYELLGLVTFFTTGPDETRAWIIKEGSRAARAGGVIHSDFEKHFIRAEVINWQVLLDCGGYVLAREKGLLRTEGKEYVVQDGDVIEFKHGSA